jgi:hypothetical protein
MPQFSERRYQCLASIGAKSKMRNRIFMIGTMRFTKFTSDRQITIIVSHIINVIGC